MGFQDLLKLAMRAEREGGYRPTSFARPTSNARVAMKESEAIQADHPHLGSPIPHSVIESMDETAGGSGGAASKSQYEREMGLREKGSTLGDKQSARKMAKVLDDYLDLDSSENLVLRIPEEGKLDSREMMWARMFDRLTPKQRQRVKNVWMHNQHRRNMESGLYGVGALTAMSQPPATTGSTSEGD